MARNSILKFQYREAENRLLAGLRKNTDGPVSRYLNRPISLKITKYLLKTSITPNQISFFSFMLATVGAAFFFIDGYLYLAVGAVLAQVASVVDGCDGEIARLKFKITGFGGWFDAVLDRYADAFLLLGLTWHVWSADGNFLVFFIGFMAIIGSFMNSYTADKYDGLMKRKLDIGKQYFRVGRDVRVFIIFVGALINQPLSTLIFIALLMNTENVRRVVVLYKAEKNDIDRVIRRIEEIIGKSSVPEDPVHSRNTLEWLLKFKPDADIALRIAALGHDTERALEHRKVKRRDYADYDSFKEAHAEKSAKVLAGIMKECNIHSELIDDVVFLVRHHETGGDPRADLLRDADSVSFFQVNLPFFYARNGVEETRMRCRWGLKRLSSEMETVVEGFEYENKELSTLLENSIAEYRGISMVMHPERNLQSDSGHHVELSATSVSTQNAHRV